MKTRRFGVDIALAAAFVLLAFVSVRSAQGAKYGLKLKTDKLYYFRTITDRTILQTVGAKPQKSKETLEVGINVDVNSIDANGIMVLDCNYVLVKVKRDGPFGKIDYDSSKKPAEPTAQSYATLLGERFRIYMAPSGRIKRFSGLNQMYNRLGKKLPEGPSRAQSVGELEPFIAEAKLKQWIEYSMAIFPDKPVDIGDSWKRESSFLRRYPMVVEDTFTLKGIKRRTATVEVVSTVKPHPTAEPERMGGFATISYDFTGKHQGQIIFKEVSGMITQHTIKKELSGQRKMEMAIGDGKAITTPINIKEVITFEMSRRRDDEEKVQNMTDMAEEEAKRARRKAEKAEKARRKAEEAKKKTGE